MFYPFANHLLTFVLSAIGSIKMNETQLLLWQILIQINMMQEIIATGIKENTTRVQNKGGLRMMDRAKLADFQFRYSNSEHQ